MIQVYLRSNRGGFEYSHVDSVTVLGLKGQISIIFTKKVTGVHGREYTDVLFHPNPDSTLMLRNAKAND